MSKILNFQYRKKNDEIRKVKLHQLAWDEKAIEGIDLIKLTEDEARYLNELRISYDNYVSYLMPKAYRRFLHTGIEGDITKEEL